MSKYILRLYAFDNVALAKINIYLEQGKLATYIPYIREIKSQVSQLQSLL